MNGLLRHSKSHRETVKRQWQTQAVRYEITLPHGLGRPTGPDAIIFPKGSVMQAYTLLDYGSACRLIVDAPKAARIIVPSGVTVNCLGPVPKAADGTVTAGKQRETWNAERLPKSKMLTRWAA